MSATAATAQAESMVRAASCDDGHDAPASGLARFSTWEFWPAWAVYAPLVPYLAWLGLRHGGLTVCTACNPSIPLGGIVGESKSEILSLLPRQWVAPFGVIEPGAAAQREAALARFIGEQRRGWPVVLKPDRGERGEGVRIVRGAGEAAEYLAARRDRVIAQAYHPGPFEAGVFYVRHPSAERGFLFSITDKRFPSVVGDGRATLAELVDAHPRFRRQRTAHLAALGRRAAEVPALGERVALTRIGNHCRGTMFLDGRALITPALEAAFERIVSASRGVNFGRFDVRYADPHEFAAGRGFWIIEFNGLLSESTNMYDPAFGYWRAQRVLRQQWRLAFEVGRGNIEHGAGAASLMRVLREIGRERRRRAELRRETRSGESYGEPGPRTGSVTLPPPSPYGQPDRH
jgi:hypothetical protein